MGESTSVSDKALNDAARDVFIWQSGDYNAVIKLRGTVLHSIASAMHQRFGVYSAVPGSETEEKLRRLLGF